MQLFRRGVWSVDSCGGGVLSALPAATSKLTGASPAKLQPLTGVTKRTSDALMLGIALIRLHAIFPGGKIEGRSYTAWVREIWEWVDNSGLLGRDNLVGYGVAEVERNGKVQCQTIAGCNGERVWSNVQGQYVRFAAEYSRMTLDFQAKEKAVRVMKAAIEHFAVNVADLSTEVQRQGDYSPSLRVFHEVACTSDQQKVLLGSEQECQKHCILYKGMFARDLSRAIEVRAGLYS